MRGPSPLSSGAFRFALLVALVFAAGTIGLRSIVVHAVDRYATEAARDSVAAELALLQEERRISDQSVLIQSILWRESGIREHQFHYLLVDRNGRRLAGSLPAAASLIGWHRLALAINSADADTNGTSPTFMALGARNSDGSTLVVANDTSDLDELRRGLDLSTAAIGTLITLLALVGGFVVGNLFLRRLERVNLSIERIMGGSLDERLPAIGLSPELEHLSTNLNRMLDRIGALMDGLRQMSTGIAHDLRTPLTRLRHRLELMRQSRPGSAIEEEIDAALRQTDEILSIFRALLRISALEAGTGRLRPSNANASELMEQLHAAYLPAAQDSDHALVAAIEPDLWWCADWEMLTQAITNLIENAMFHTPAGTEIEMGLARRHNGIGIFVADHGPGVPPAERDKILQRFYRIDSSRGAPGAGLGLALVAAVAAIHRANLSLTDNHPGLRVEIELTA